MEKKDDIIIKMLYDRSEAALEIIQNLYGRLIKSIAFNLFKSDVVAEECMNDVLLAIWETIPPEKPESVASYACMIARRRAIDRIRREKAQKRYISENSEYSSVCEELCLFDDTSDQIVDKIELKRVMNQFVGGLSSTNREIFISRFYDFEPVESISGRMHMSSGSVRTRLSRMRNDLRELLRKENMIL